MSFQSPEICILMLSANPRGLSSLRLDEEKREIDLGLKQSQHREQFNLVKKEAVRARDLRRAMLELNPEIVHFSGHGTGEQGLAFEDETGHVKLVDAAALAGLFALFAETLQCVVLNACYSEIQAEAIAQHIPYVIGMSSAIGDQAAIEFAVGFYDALGAGREIEFAYKMGCQSIQLMGIPEHLIPVLKHKSRSSPPISPAPILSKLPQDVTSAPQHLLPLMPSSASRSTSLSEPKRRRSRLFRYYWILGGLAVACIGAMSLIPQVRQTLGISKPACFEQAAREKKLIVAIANFQIAESDAAKAPFIKERLLDRLTTRLPQGIETCPISSTPASNREAEELGEKLDATIVLWGRLNSLGLEIYLTRVGTATLGYSRLTLSKTDAEEFETQVQMLPEVSYVMTATALSNTYRQNKDHATARKVLQEALDWAELKNLKLENPNMADHLALAYFTLGQLYTPSEWSCSATKQNCLSAIEAYKKSAAINSQTEQAVIEQGILYERLENPEEAIKIYSQIIQSDPESEKSLEVRGYRADIYLSAGKIQEAIQDLRFICQRYPGNHNYLSYLGQAHLRAGQIREAEEVYLQLKQLLGKDKAGYDKVINDLEMLAKDYPETKLAAEKILVAIK